MGTQSKSFEEVGDILRLHSGGLSTGVYAFSSLGNLSTTSNALSLSSYFIDDQTKKHSSVLFGVMEDVLRDAKWDDLDRLYTLLNGLVSSSMNSIASAGHQYAMSAAVKYFSPSLTKAELYGGLEHVTFLNKNVKEDKAVLGGISMKLKEIAEFLLSSRDTKYAINATEFGYKETSSALRGFSDSFKWNTSQAELKHTFSTTSLKESSRQVFPVPFNVNYTAKAFTGVPYTHADSIPLQVLSSMMTTHYLHKEIREKG